MIPSLCLLLAKHGQTDTSDFEAVVVVKASHKGGIDGLKGLNYCHPGFRYNHAERWTERFLKHFERFVSSTKCESNATSPAEIEVAAVANFFGSACRPGAWSNNREEDLKLSESQLKDEKFKWNCLGFPVSEAKYPQLCELCSSSNPNSNCDYEREAYHIEALRCLLNQGQVAYVSLQDAQDFFSPVNIYHLNPAFASV